jgi:fumarate hydratase class II
LFLYKYIFKYKILKGVHMADMEISAPPITPPPSTATTASAPTSTAVLTALVSKLGYKKTSEIAKTLSSNVCSVKDYVIKEGLITEEEYNRLTSPEAVLSLGSATQ